MKIDEIECCVGCRLPQTILRFNPSFLGLPSVKKKNLWSLRTLWTRKPTTKWDLQNQKVLLRICMLTKKIFVAVWPPYRVDDGPNAAKYFIFLKRLLTLATTTKWWRFVYIPETLGFGSALGRNGFKPRNIELGISSFLAKLCQRFGEKKWKKTRLVKLALFRP